MNWRVWVGGAIAIVGAVLLANYVRVLPQQPAFAPTTAILWALGLLTLGGLLIAGWGLWREREAEG